MDYKDLLKKAKKELPEVTESNDRFEPVKPILETHGKNTIIKNFSDIAKNLRRDKKTIAKYLFKTLGIKGAITGDTLDLNGVVEFALIRKRIEDFTKEFVMCHECGKVDTKLSIEKKIAEIKCEACGAKKTIKW
ncbi:translation initiation factor IF-2 subunit beta [archaeon]|nr:translation initiation factor IF-2 subunit beta [archaeon]|tara:strand:+ start:650 stop:1051 length:402 start_codon:yes stop_codon:yes gene_type:complete